jgi:hypothetical protein
MLNNIKLIINKEKTRYQRKLINMNKLRLPLTLLLLAFIAFIVQSCNKDTVTAYGYTTAPIQANIDGDTWVPDTTSLAITYNSASGTKTLSFSGQKNTRQVIFSVSLPNTNTTGFPLNTYNINQVNILAQYNTQQQNGSGAYVFTPHGTVEPGAGAIIVTAIDSVKKLITGTFSFYSRTTTYDNQGNVVSINVDNIEAGEFTTVPYTFTSN